MGSSAINYDQLAAQHGGIDYDALAAQHGGKPALTSITANPNGEGAYQMIGQDGKVVAVPYSNVIPAQGQKYKFTSSSESSRWHKDYSYAVDKNPNLSEAQKFEAQTQTFPGDPVARTAIVGTIGDLLAPLLHPVQTAKGAVAGAENPAVAASQLVGSVRQNYQDGGAAYAATRLGSNLAAAVMQGQLMDGTAAAVPRLRALPSDVGEGMLHTLAGDAVDHVIPGDTVTPRQQYQIAKGQGVNLDLAQATGAGPAGMVKRPIEHSLQAQPIFEAAKGSNLDALNQHVGDLLDSVGPQMTREEFGKTSQQTLLDHQHAMNDQAGQIFDQLSQEAGATQPDTTNVRQAAQKIVAVNQRLFSNHPEMLRGGAGQAWQVINNLAKEPEVAVPAMKPTGVLDSSGNPIMREVPAPQETPDTWSDLHKLRSGLMDMYRSPDLVGSQAEGWLKQMTGEVDKAMTGAASGLTPDQMARFRGANEIYSAMKDTFDNPQHPFYHISRAGTGSAAADQLANIRPQLARYIDQNMPDLTPMLQRQTMERILSPAGNATPDYGTLPGRFSRAQKEQLRGVLSDSQINALDNVARTSRVLKMDSNPSGSAKSVQAAGEVTGPLSIAAEALLHGDPLTAAGSLAGGYGWVKSAKWAAQKMNDPAFVDRVMSTGPDAWTNAGAKKLSAVGVADADIKALQGSARGRKLLLSASAVSPESKAMRALVASISEINSQGQK